MHTYPRHVAPATGLLIAAALQDGPTRRSFNAETRASMAMAAAGFEAAHYIQAQKIRTRVDSHFRWASIRLGWWAVGAQAKSLLCCT